ncbi:MAG TPA: sporulation integral membrane protein YtvI [Desulfobacteria bacterium]|nr:sporulation integral membrane protein YtvI [Desulfobacteria bacterium]
MNYFIKNLFLIAIGAFVGYLFFQFVAPLIAPFIVAVFLAFLIEPVVGFLQRRAKLPRALAVGSAMLTVFGGLGFVITLAVTRLIVELVLLSKHLPRYIYNVESVVLSWQESAGNYYFNLPADVRQFISERLTGTNYNLETVVRNAQVLTGRLLNLLLQLFSVVPIWVVLVVIAGIATYFMSKDKRIILLFWIRSLPAPWGTKSVQVTKEIFQAIINYIRAQLILISITFLQTLAGLYLIDAPYVLLMALIIGVADLIPVLGPSSIYIPWIIWSFATGDTAFAVKLLILFGIVIIVRQILETKIVSTTMGLHPLATLVAMYVGLKLFGAMGVVAGPLFLITVKAFASAGLLSWGRE